MEQKDKKNTKQLSFEDVAFEEVKTLEDGKYKGVIADVSRDTNNFDYTRYTVNIIDNDMSLMLSFPTRLTYLQNGKPSSQHAVFLQKMGNDYNDIKNTPVFDVVMSCVGKEIVFLVNNKETEKGTFSEIVKDSVKLSN